MMRSRTRTRPSSTLPALHSLQLSRLINLYNAIDLSIRMHMILSRILFLRIHVHSRDAEIVVLGGRETDLAAAILRTVYFDIGNPSIGEALPNVVARSS